MKYRLIPLLISIILSPSILIAKDVDRLYLETLIHNQDIQVIKNNIETSKLRYKQKYKAFLPSLSASASKSRTKSNTAVDKDFLDRTEVSLQGRINLFNGFFDKASLNMEDLNLKVTLLEYQIKNAEVTNLINKAYIDYLYQKELLRLSKTILTKRQEQTELLELRYESGREDKGAYLQSKAQYVEAKFQVQKNERDLKLAESNIKKVVGDDKLDLSFIKEELNESLFEKIKITPEDDLVTSIPQYEISKINLSLKDKEITRSKSAFSPSLSLQASHGLSGLDEKLDNKTWGVGLTLSIPLYDGGADYYGVKQAKIEKISSEYILRKTFNDLKFELTRKHNDYLDQTRNLDIQKEYLRALKLREEVISSQYRSGLVTYTNWDIVQNDYIRFEINRLSSMKAYYYSLFDLNYLLGKGSL